MRGLTLLAAALSWTAWFLVFGLWPQSGGRVHAANPFMGLWEWDSRLAGTTVLPFLKLPEDAHSLALGGRSLTADPAGGGILSNPAALPMRQEFAFHLSHMEHLGEFRQEYVAGAFPAPGLFHIRNAGGFGASARLMTPRGFAYARDYDEEPNRLSAHDFAAGLAYGTEIWPGRISIGGRFDLVHSAINEARAFGFYGDLATLLQLPVGLRLALTAERLSPGIRYNTPTAPLEPLPTRAVAELGRPMQHSGPTDGTYRLGHAWHAGAYKTNEGALWVYGGAELHPIPPVALRIGMERPQEDRGLGQAAGFSLGVGLRQEAFHLDYGFRYYGPLGHTHALSLGMAQTGQGPANSDELLRRARQRYAEGDGGAALRLARRSLALNPNNWNAIALIRHIELERMRRDGSSITLFYTANTLGQLAPFQFDSLSLGGLPRRATKLKKLKREHSHTLLLDAGDVSEKQPQGLREPYLFGAYARMGYHAVNAGHSEHGLGGTGIKQASRIQRMPWVSANMKLAGAEDAALRYRDFSFPLRRKGWNRAADILAPRRLRVRVIGAIDPVGMTEARGGGTAPAELLPSLKPLLGPVVTGPRESELRILLLHGTLQTARTIAAAYPALDVIILSGATEALKVPLQVGQTLIVCPGERGTHLGSLTLSPSLRGTRYDWTHELHALELSVPGDADMEAFLAPVLADGGLDSLKPLQGDPTALFAYLHQSASEFSNRRLFLRDTRRELDFGLLPGRDSGLVEAPRDCSTPALSPRTGYVACIDIESDSTLWLLAPDGGRIRKVEGARSVSQANWSADGRLVYLSRSEGRGVLVRGDAEGKGREILTREEHGDIQEFHLSEDGRRIAMHTRIENRERIMIADPGMEKTSTIQAMEGFASTLRLSPDGRRLAALWSPPGIGSGPRLAVIGLDGDSLRVLAPTRVHSFAWSSTGKSLVYSSGVNVRDLGEIHLESGGMRKLTRDAAAPRSEERPRPFRLGVRDGVLFEAQGDGARRILWVDLETAEEIEVVKKVGSSYLQ